MSQNLHNKSQESTKKFSALYQASSRSSLKPVCATFARKLQCANTGVYRNNRERISEIIHNLIKYTRNLL